MRIAAIRVITYDDDVGWPFVQLSMLPNLSGTSFSDRGRATEAAETPYSILKQQALASSVE
jgi:hypothetical protein